MWRYALILPLAALLLGQPLIAPKRKPAIPSLQDGSCNYAFAVKNYFQAYAYAAENRATALKFLRASERERSACSEDTSALAQRIAALKKALFP